MSYCKRSYQVIFCLSFVLAGVPRAIAGPGCESGPNTLCLNDDRFRVTCEWADFADNPETVPPFAGMGPCGAVEVTDDFGGFYFNDPRNVDVRPHIFAGCGFNNRFWVFAAGLTNVQTALTVTDLETGEVRSFDSPAGQQFEPIQDTQAFATCPKALAPAPPPAVKRSTGPKGGCTDTATELCLFDGRFAVSADAFGGAANATRAADGTAFFDFGNPTFFDLQVNVVDGRSANSQYWVKYSLFDPTDVTIRLRDTVTGNVNTYVQSSSDPLSVTDQAAFAEALPLTIDATLAGAYFSTERDGEGFIVDITVIDGVPILILYYFTYDEGTGGRQAWVVGSAPIIGNYAAVPAIIAAGGVYGPGFDPGDVTRRPWGYVRVSFPECGTMAIESASSIFEPVAYATQRLTPAPRGVQGVCAAPTPAGAEIAVEAKGALSIDGGYAGSWFAPTRDGEGFIFNIFDAGGTPTLTAFYFTYDSDGSGRQAWMVGTASIAGNVAEVPLVITSGTNFGSAFDPTAVVRDPWGTLKVTFNGCNSANVMLTSGSFGNVAYDVQRLAPLAPGVTGDCATAR